MTVLAVAADAVRTTVASYSLGSGSLTLVSVPAAMPTPTTAAPIYITVATLATYGTFPETFCTYKATGLSINTLTGLTVISGTDTAWNAGDIVEMRGNAGYFNDLSAVVASGIAPGNSGQLLRSSSGTIAGAADLGYGTSGQLNFVGIAAPGSPNNGDTWLDSTQLCQTNYDSGLINYRSGVIYNQVAKVTVTASGASSFVSTTGAAGSVSLPAGYLNVNGSMLRLTAGGYGTTASSSAGTNAIFIKLGSNVIATVPTNNVTASATNACWAVWVNIATKATGATGKLDSNGLVIASSSAVTTFPANVFGNGTVAGTMAPQTQVTLDLTAAYVFDLQITMTAATNSFTLTNLVLEVLA